MRPTGRLVSLGALTAILVVQPMPALAQQGSLQVSTAVQTLHGDPQRFAGQHPLEPDIGISWLQPGSRFGMFQIEIRGARRGDTLHTGRIYGALRDAKYGGIAWTIEAGDAYFSPGVSDYRFSNLFTPAVTFNGAAVTGRTEHDVVTVVAGRSTAWRSIFGNDPQGLGQSLAIARITHRPTNRLELSARGSRVRTSSLREFSYTIDASDQVGAGATVGLTSSLRLVADASLVSYRRAGVESRERDGSYLGGLSWLHSRGWIQVNASRFSAGDFPALNNPLHDREEVFAAAEQDLTSRTRVSGGWEKFRSNLNPERSASSTTPVPESAGTRGFGAFRVQLTSRSAVTVRGERGDRESRPVGPGFYSDSDTGMWAAEWQAAVGGTTAFVRYSGRENVEHLNETGSYDQRDALAQIYANVTRRSQIFGTAMLTHTAAGPGGNNYWQTGGGGQVRMGNRDLWLRGESTIARNMDLLTRVYVPRESLIVGVNGQMSRSTTLAFNVNLDRTPVFASAGSPWVTRSMVRVTRNLPTGSVYMANTIASAAAESGRGTGTVSGLVFADWNANGVQDAGERALEGIPMRLGNRTLGHGARWSVRVCERAGRNPVDWTGYRGAADRFRSARGVADPGRIVTRGRQTCRIWPGAARVDRRAGHPGREWKRQGRPERGTHRRRRCGSRQRRAFRAGAKGSIPVRGRSKRDTPRQAADRVAPGRRDHRGRRRTTGGALAGRAVSRRLLSRFSGEATGDSKGVPVARRDHVQQCRTTTVERRARGIASSCDRGRRAVARHRR